MARANLAHAFVKTRMRRDHTTCAQNRLHDKGCDGIRSLKGNLVFHRLQAKLCQLFGVRLVERIAISIGGGQVVTACQQRLVLRAEIGIAVDRRAARVGAVVALLERQVFRASRLAAHLVVLACQTQHDLDTV